MPCKVGNFLNVGRQFGLDAVPLKKKKINVHYGIAVRERFLQLVAQAL